MPGPDNKITHTKWQQKQDHKTLPEHEITGVETLEARVGVVSLSSDSEGTTGEGPADEDFTPISNSASCQPNSNLVLICSVPHSIPLFLSHISFLSSADPASQHSSSFCPFTSIAPYPVLPPMPAPLTPCITLAATGTAVGRLPRAGRPPTGRVSVSPQINALPDDWSTPAGREPECAVAWPR